MNRMIKSAFVGMAFLIALAATASAQTNNPLPPTEQVVGMMMQLDAQRRAQMSGYEAVRRYFAVNKNRHAEMVVHVECSSDGAKEFSILSEEGNKFIRKHVFKKLLREEADASHRGARNSTLLIPANYHFQLLGKESLATGPAYVLSVSPKTDNKFLINGKIWVNATDYSIVRVEGQPARNPSFWVHDVRIVHTYQKVGQFWLASSTRSTSEVRIFGPSELTIESSDYLLHVPRDRSVEADGIARLLR